MGRAHDTRRCAKRTCCLISRKGRFAACSRRNSTDTFILFIFIHQFKLFFSLVSRPLDSTRPDQQYFLPGNAPGGAFCPNFVLKNTRLRCKRPAQGRYYFGIVLWNAPGGVYSVLKVCTTLFLVGLGCGMYYNYSTMFLFVKTFLGVPVWRSIM